MSAEMATFMVMHDLDDRPVGADDGRAYGHISLTPNFVVDESNVNAMVDTVHEIAEIFDPFSVWPYGYSLYGPKSKPVVEVASEEGKLREIHDYCMLMLGSVGCRFKSTIDTGNNYAPHTRKLSFHQEDEHVVDSLSIVQCLPARIRRRPRIFDVVSLGGLTDRVFDSQLSDSLVQ